jgi:hypothetical protein
MLVGSPGIYHIALKIPAEISEGDQSIVLGINGINSPVATVKIQLPTIEPPLVEPESVEPQPLEPQ